MGLFNFRKRHEENTLTKEQVIYTNPVTPGAPNTPGFISADESIYPYSNKEYVFPGTTIKAVNIADIQINPQKKIQQLWQLCNYFSNSDEVIHAIIYNCFVPYLTNPDYYLTCANKKTIEIYNKYYKKIRLREKIESIFTELVIYGTSFVYIMNGVPITLPHNKVRIANTMFNGQPVVEFNTETIKSEIQPKNGQIQENYLPEYDKNFVIKGYPPEVQEAVQKNIQWAQLNPKNTFVLQLPHEGYTRYSIPWICSALDALKRKQFIREYELAQLQLGAVVAIHVAYGDAKKDADITPDINQLAMIRRQFVNGIKSNKGCGVVVTNQLAKAEILNKSVGDMYQWPLYSQVNNDILSAAGISQIVATGVSSEGSSFSTAQVSMQTLEARLDRMLREFEELMTTINERLKFFMPETYNLKTTPEFKFKPVSLSGKKALREEVLTLYDKGLVSAKTTTESHGYSYVEETEQIKSEPTKEIETKKTTTTNEEVGRPSLSPEERNSPIENSLSGNPSENKNTSI